MLKFAKVRDVHSPERGTTLSGGIDFFIPNDFEKKTIDPGSGILVKSGIKSLLPEGYALVALNKSGIVLNHNVIVGAALVDEDYQGEIGIHIINVGHEPFEVNPGQKMVQFCLIKMNYCDLVEVKEEHLFDHKTKRGEGGFGSTGLHKI